MRIKLSPWKRLEIRSYTLFPDLDQLIDVVAAPVPLNTPAQTNLLWAHGVAFRHVALPNSDTLAQYHLSGFLIWDNVDLASMPKFESERHPSSKPMVTVQLIDVSRNSLFGPVAEFLKKQLL